MCVLLLLDEMVDRRPLNPVDWWYCWVWLCLYWFCGYWTCLLLIESCWSLNYSGGFIYFLLQQYQFLPHVFWYSVKLTIVMSSWRIGPLSIMKCLSLTLIIFLAQKSALFEINIATSTFFWLVWARISFSFPLLWHGDSASYWVPLQLQIWSGGLFLLNYYKSISSPFLWVACMIMASNSC